MYCSKIRNYGKIILAGLILNYVVCMLAAVLHGKYDLRVKEIPKPRLSSGYVMIKVELVGICGTDKAFYKGTYSPLKLPIILGHELVGKVVEVGRGVPKDLIGQRVVTEINIVCGKCWFCKEGLRTHCPYRKTIGISIDGGMAEYVAVPYENIHIVNDLTPNMAIFVEPLAAVFRAFQIHPLPPGSSVAILGVGNLGLLTLQLVKSYGASLVIPIYRRESVKTKLARKLGADYVVTYDEALKLAKELTPEGQGFDAVVEVTGSPEGLDLALNLVRPRGIIYAKSTHGAPVSFNYTKAVVNEVEIVTSRCGPFPQAINALRKGIVKVDELITDIYNLRDAVKAFEKALSKDSIKVALRP